MATSTTNLGLIKPSVNDAADIGVLNSNFDKIDEKCNPALFAPSGYGLGEYSSDLGHVDTVAKLDALRVNRWFLFAGQNNSDPLYVDGIAIGYGSGRVDNYNENNVKMTLWPYYATAQANQKELVRYCVDGIWTPWEWVNPPMIPGVEYRTTERWNGKPVYTKAVNCGAMGQNTADDVYHDAAYIEVVWVSGGYWTDGGTRFSLPYIGGADDNQIYVSAYGSAIHRVHKGSVYNILDMTVMIKYTKSTD